MIGTTAALLGSAAIPAVGNLIGGILGKKSAKKSAQIQAEAAEKAGQSVIDTTNQVNPSIGNAAQYAGAQVTQAAGNAGAGVASAADRANAQLDPWRTAGQDASGTLQTGLQEGGAFNRTPTAEDIQADPGFAWRLKQGQIALERSQAARGTGLGGGALKALTRYSQGYASNEYGNAFDRYQTNTQNRYSNLFNVSQQGQQAAGVQGSNLMNAGTYSGNAIQNAAQYSGDAGMNSTNLMASNSINATRTAADYTTGAAQARAAGVVGGTNAVTGAISGATGAASDALTLSALLKNPTPKFANPAIYGGAMPRSYGAGRW